MSKKKLENKILELEQRVALLEKLITELRTNNTFIIEKNNDYWWQPKHPWDSNLYCEIR